MREHSRLRLKRKWNKTGKATRFILKRAQLAQVIDAMMESLNVSIEHRTRATAAHFMPRPMGIQPFLCCFLATTDLVTHDWVENFCATPSHRTEASCSQCLERVPNRLAKNSLREMSNLDRSKRLDVKIRIQRANCAK